jgi:ketosteroid isomerase-like protein
MPHIAPGETQCKVRAGLPLHWHWTGETGYPKIGGDDRSPRFCEGVISDCQERGLIIEEMDEHNIRAAIARHWAASAAGDQVGEHEIYHDDVVCEYPQSSEIIYGRRNLQALRSHHPDKPSEFTVRRIVGEGNLWLSEYVINYGGKRVFTVSVMEFRDGKVSHETQYFADSFDAPAWRAQWVARAS